MIVEKSELDIQHNNILLSVKINFADTIYWKNIYLRTTYIETTGMEYGLVGDYILMDL